MTNLFNNLVPLSLSWLFVATRGIACLGMIVRRGSNWGRLGGVLFGLLFGEVWAQEKLPPVDPAGTEERFEPVQVRQIRMIIAETNAGEPAIDEFEVFGPENPLRNLARQSEGTTATASNEYSGESVVRHRVSLVNDGKYGNDSSWVADSVGASIQLQFASIVEIDRIVWSRDRSGLEITRAPIDYRIEVSLDGEDWFQVANSEARLPFRQPRAGSEMPVLDFPTIGPVTDWSSNSHYVVHQWHAVDGLPSEEILAIAQTPDGFLWLGGEFGLVRFDGRQFRRVRLADLAQGAFGSVVELLVASDGTLWVSSSLGKIGVLRDGRFVGKDWNGGTVNQLAEGTNGVIWGASVEGLCSTTVSAAEVVLMDPGEPAQLVVADRDQRIYYSRFGAVREWLRNESRVLMEGGSGALFSSGVIAPRAQGGIWLYDREGGLRASLPNGLVTSGMELPFTIGEEIRYQILEDRGGNLWVVANEDGVYRIGPDGACERFVLPHEMGRSSGVHTLFEDRRGAIWVGTVDSGLYRIRSREFDLFPLGVQGLAALSVCGGGEGEIFGVDRLGRTYSIAGGAAQLLDIEPTRILMCDDAAKRFWSAPRVWENHTLEVWSREGEFSRDLTATMPIPGNPVHCVVRGNDGQVLFGLKNNLAIYDNGRFQKVLAEGQLSVGQVRFVVPGLGSKTWLTGEMGLLWEVDGTEVLQVETPAGLASAPISALYSPDGMTLWVGTLGEGLWRLHNGTWRSIGTRMGFLPKEVRGIIEDGNGGLWLGGRKGFYRIDLHSLDAVDRGLESSIKWSFWKAGQGASQAQVTIGSQPNAWMGGDGTLYFATTLGVVAMQPSGLPNVFAAPRVVIEQVSVDGADYEIPIADGDFEVIVSESDALIEIRYTVPEIDRPDNVRVEHRLEGRDVTWRPVAPGDEIQYRSLGKGVYHVKLRAAVADSDWRTQDLKLTLRVEAPFWESRSFALVALGGGLGLIIGLGVLSFIGSLRSQLRSAQKLQSVDRERARIAADMHDRLGSRLTHLGLIARDLKEGGDARLCSKIRESVYESARNLDEIVWAVDPSKDTVESFVAYCMNLVDESSEQSDVRWRIVTPQETSGLAVSALVRHEVFLALEEAMNNVTKHSGASEAWLRIGLVEGRLTVEIEDKGRGFDLSEGPSSARRGNGLKGMRARMTRIGGRFEIQSAVGQGTRVVFTVADMKKPKED